MMPRPPLPDDDPTTVPEMPDLGREEDLDRSLDDAEPERSVPREEERPPTSDERGPDDLPAIEPDDATPSEDPGISPI